MVRDLARLEALLGGAPAPIREPLLELIQEGLRRRYGFGQLLVGFEPEGFEGVLGVLLDHLAEDDSWR